MRLSVVFVVKTTTCFYSPNPDILRFETAATKFLRRTMATAADTSGIAHILEDAAVNTGSVSSFIKHLSWKEIFAQGEQAENVTKQLGELFPDETPRMNELLCALIMKSCNRTSTGTNRNRSGRIRSLCE